MHMHMYMCMCMCMCNMCMLMGMYLPRDSMLNPYIFFVRKRWCE